VDGKSTGCTGASAHSNEDTPRIPGAGWDAVKGWDPVTGLGTPLFDKLLEVTTGTNKYVAWNAIQAKGEPTV